MTSEQPKECEECGLSYRTLTDSDVKMHEKYCPYKDGNGMEPYHAASARDGLWQP